MNNKENMLAVALDLFDALYGQIHYAIILNAYNQNVYGQCENPAAVENALSQVSSQIEEFYSLIKM